MRKTIHTIFDPTMVNLIIETDHNAVLNSQILIKTF